MKTEIEITPLLSHIEQFVNINFSSDDVNLLDEIITVQKFQKGNILLRENEVSSKSFFIINGLIRLYYNINGAEKTAYFYTENQFVTAFESYTKKKPSSYYFECIEDCTLAIITYDVEQALLKKFPTLEVLSRLILEEELSIYQNIIASFVTLSPEERYINLIENNSKLLNRIPQYHLASYLRVSPESLSRIRKRIFSK
jgi:CRP-like cAMP-binding protein